MDDPHLKNEEPEAMSGGVGWVRHSLSLPRASTPSGHPAELSTQELFFQEQKDRGVEIGNCLSELVISSGHAVSLDMQ